MWNSRLKDIVRRVANAAGYEVRRIQKPLFPMFPIKIDLPALLPEHVADAALYADRNEALAGLPRNGVVAELGVAFGDFSETMIHHLKPLRFDAFDIFRGHESETFWDRPTAECFGELSHRQFYERRFAKEIATNRLCVYEGDSATELGKQPDATYDVIYIDSDHSFAGVVRDANVATRKVKPDGILVFNDYIMFDYHYGVPYGVAPVVHDLCVNHGWQVAYIALQRDLFFDIALRRKRQ